MTMADMSKKFACLQQTESNNSACDASMLHNTSAHGGAQNFTQMIFFCFSVLFICVISKMLFQMRHWKERSDTVIIPPQCHVCQAFATMLNVRVSIKDKTTGNPSHQQQQLKVTHSAANKWPGSGLLTLSCVFLSSFPVSTIPACCASLLSLGHASEPWIQPKHQFCMRACWGTGLITKHVDFEENRVVKLGRPVPRHACLRIFQFGCLKITSP
jgi:hypothetical protein